VDQAKGAGLGSLEVEVVADERGFRGVLDEWDDLFEASVHAPPYLSRAWIEPWWRHFGGSQAFGPLAGRSTLHVVTVRDGGRLVAAAPWLSFSLGVGPFALRTLVGIGQETADYGGVLLGAEPQRTGPVLADRLERELHGRRTVVDLTRLAPDDPWLTLLRDRFAAGPFTLRAVQQEDYPRLDLTAMEDPVREVARRLKKNDVRRRWRRLDEAHGATFTYHRPGNARDDLATFLDLHDRRWATKDHPPAGLFSSPAGRAFVSDAAAALDEAGLLRLSFVEAGGKAIVGRFGFEHRGVYHGVKSGWDPEFAHFGPGHLVVGRILEHAAESGLDAFDFMRGAGDHKAAWSGEDRAVSYWVAEPRDRFLAARERAMWGALALRTRRRSSGTASGGGS
jgi:CelD/BcsL family acetyltransferase involved in cellulose biosynthesis